MSRNSLSTLVFILFLLLSVLLVSSDRGISRVMEGIGSYISRHIS
jgi:hypothetical protein